MEVPSGRTSYQTQLDATEELGVLVNMTAGIDVSSREAFWILEAIDPETGDPPSDSRLGVIHRLRDGESCLWLEGPDLAGVNGLLVHGDRLLAATFGSEALLSINLESATIRNIVSLRPFGGDGVVADGENGFLVSDFLGLLLRVTEAGDREVLIDSRDAGISLTDLGYAPELGLVVIPTLRGNSVLGFSLGK